ncbi:CpsD/CapB family tyrosine-protein kinase [Clostridium sp. DL1XJH146]
MFIVKNDPKSLAAEAYRTLRTNIQYSSIDEEIKTILITSAVPTEGKSSITGNLALVLANNGKNVLVIDCDMRKPTIHKKMNISNKVGLSNFLAGEVEFINIVQEYENNVFVITAGSIPPNPAEILESNKMNDFINKMKNQFDYVIIDSPPIIVVTDAQVLAPKVDGVILVVASKKADREATIRAKELLEKVQANLIGAVLNKVEVIIGKGYKSKYGYQYYYGEKDDNKKKKKRAKNKIKNVS